MRKKLFIVLAIALVLASTALCFAATDSETMCATALYNLGLFKGTGTKADGSPEYALDRAPSRQEAVTMLVRLLGKETEANEGKWDIPFTDVDAWAKPYVGYAYANGLTKGVSDTKFGSGNKTSEAQYITFVLRALGYSDSEGDFTWDKARELSDKIDVTDPTAKYVSFTRGSAAEISYNALGVNMKGAKDKLIDKLYEEDAVTADGVNAFCDGSIFDKYQTVYTDKNGNQITYQWPSNHNDGAVMSYGYIQIQFSSDIADIDVDKLVLRNEDTGKALKIGSCEIAYSYKNLLLVTPEEFFKYDVTYSLYVPAGSVSLKNGTTYDGDFYVEFIRAKGDIDADVKIPASMRPENAETVLKDSKGTEIVYIYPNDYLKNFDINYEQVVFQFNKDVKEVAPEKVAYYNADSKELLNVTYSKAGTTSKDCLVLGIDSKWVKGTTYYINIPAGSIEMADGTFYGGDIYLQFTK